MKIIRIMGLFSSIFAIFSCQAQDKGFESLPVEAFKRAIADTTVVRLDVRTAEEFAEGHIEKAINIDVLKSDFEQIFTALFKNISHFNQQKRVI